MTRELVKSNGSVPMLLTELDPPDFDKHWRNELCVIMVLFGDMRLCLSDQEYSLISEDIVVLNPNTTFALRADTGTAIFLEMDTKIIKSLAAFDCNSANFEDKSRFYTLKHLMALLAKENSGNTPENTHVNDAIAFSLLAELQRSFPADSESEGSSDKHKETLDKIKEYLNTHYHQGISLKEIAATLSFSPSYFSVFFKRYFGMGFAEYYNIMRLKHAVRDLDDNNCSRSIEEIAHSNGFADVRSFVTLFKKEFGVLPSVYRKEQKDAEPPPHSEYESSLYGLSHYLDPPRKTPLPVTHTAALSESAKDIGSIDVRADGKPLRHHFKKFTSVGRAKEILYADVQQMLSEFQSDVGFEHIKFHGILSDDMLVYNENAAGKPVYSFVMMDKALDFLVSIGLKPLIQFSFMPKALADNPDNTIFISPMVISKPKDMKKWEDLIETVTRHFVERYGGAAVEQWLFCVWNEPNFDLFDFGFEDFFDMYKRSRAAVKRVNCKFSFGTPSLVYCIDDVEYIQRFIAMCRRNDCMPDFCNIDYYDNEISKGDLAKVSSYANRLNPWLGTKIKQNTNEDSFQNAIADMHRIFDDAGIGKMPVYLTEWNMTVSHRNLLNDTSFKSCYLAKNILENYDTLDSFGYWVLTDFIEETHPSNEHFHGGLGLFTYSGIKKAGYYVFTLLNRLGGRLIKSGKGYFITASERGVQIMLYNYEHFSHLFASGETFDMSYLERYTPFLKRERLNVFFELEGLPTECTVREHILNWKHGSAFDQWVEMGAPPITAEEVAYLKRVCVPKILKRHELTDNGVLDFNVQMEPLEVRLIEVEFF